MAKYLIEGGHRIDGELRVHGAKNAVLPILAASLMCSETAIHNCPELSDVTAAQNILEHLGCRVAREGETLTVDARNVNYCDIPDALVTEMRSSILFLGAILARCGRARVSFPGGCELGPRPIDLHISGLQKLGAVIEEDHGYLDCYVDGRPKGSEITLPFPSVGATENIILAAATAEGTTVIHNAAREPEIYDLADFLNTCGALIHFGLGDSVIIEGVRRLNGGEHSVIPDRIAAATYLCAGAITGGMITLTHTRPAHLTSVFPVLEEMGCRVSCADDEIRLSAPDRLLGIRSVKTMPYPGFPTDAQAPIMAAATVARGSSMFVETIFEARYKHAGELMRMGARIKTEGRVAVVEGIRRLHSAVVRSTDLRGGAALVIAALAADGVTEVQNIRHIDRGYARFDENLRSLGAKITREN